MGFFSKLKEGLTKTRDNIVSGIDSVFSGFSSIDDDFYDELEETLIMGDIGVVATEEILDDLKNKVKENKIKNPADCKQLLIDSIKEKMNLGENAYEFENRQSIVMLIGVNGVGKTTSIGKIANKLVKEGKKVVAKKESSIKSFVLRVDAETMDAIEKWAADEFRSTNGQLQWIIAEALKKSGRLKKKSARAGSGPSEPSDQT